ncbi:uncharacterized protein RCC_08923 [Ramularia collo-cygni]|uniref:Transcription factor CBF/NF-Y/archaeal histone domain-containing protein n=1 Tax=Ramularia collo-cygni TaxID=112498 RepID=A0A2D3VDR8_9PEZI|nr:uncharacterized protein RCC_08923 [Ramularia collo-cygni]CZT23212.1 uncharacterized protein RCC_08923 [Ramularia collo-cygni]
MPYNNTPIAPRAPEITGTVSLPLARVKKIIATDPDTSACSANAAYVITVATEMFLQHLVEQAYMQVRSEHSQKPRRNIQYRDVANAVARVENLEFLGDVVPRTTTVKKWREGKSKKVVDVEEKGLAQGKLGFEGRGTKVGDVVVGGQSEAQEGAEREGDVVMNEG